MIHKASRFVSYASAAAIVAGALFGGVQSSDAAQATANIGATIQDNGGGIGTPLTPEEIAAAAVAAAIVEAEAAAAAAAEVLAAAAAIVEAVATNVSNGTVVVTPSDPTSNLGFNPPAPAPSATDAANTTGGTVVSDGANEIPRASRPFSNASASSVSIGTRTSVGVSGGPNQAYSVILPSQTIYSSGGNIVSLNDFQHNAGPSPSMDGAGGDIFSIGASVQTVPIGEQSLIQTAPGNNSDQAATTDGTSAEADPVPSVQDIIAGTDGLSSNENQRRQILAAAFTARSPFVNIVVSYN